MQQRVLFRDDWKNSSGKRNRLRKPGPKLSPDCICFPETEQPFFCIPIEQDIAFAATSSVPYTAIALGH